MDQSVLESTGLEAPTISESRAVLRQLGNRSSVTVLFILNNLRRWHDPGVVLGFGPGLTVESAFLFSSGPQPWE